MPGLLDYVIGVVSFLLEISAVVFALYSKPRFRYALPAFYMLCTAVVQVGVWVCLEKYGVSSQEYFYVYYYTESLQMLAMFLVIIQLYEWIFLEMSMGRYIRMAASILLGVTGIFSFLVINHNRGQLSLKSIQFVVEFDQNIYFVGVVLTYLLWGAMLKLRETRTRLVQLVLALGIYFSTLAGIYALRNLFPAMEDPVLRWFPPFVAIWLPLAWSYTFARIPEEARQEPKQLLTPALAGKAS
jgi:hypothetical protein